MPMSADIFLGITLFVFLTRSKSVGTSYLLYLCLYGGILVILLFHCVHLDGETMLYTPIHQPGF